MRYFASILLAVLVFGCARKPSTPTEAALPLDATKVVAIARQAVATNDTWLAQAEFETPQHETNGSGWSVLVWRLPKTPGGHRLILIDETGKVTDYIRGR
jgi:hypothetical protein